MRFSPSRQTLTGTCTKAGTYQFRVTGSDMEPE
ncbi:MAG: putative Ig domain-containing protein [Aquabacterium sp.]|nr:putative Ig domain-containing protein [Aquabacterium sp.]